MKYEYDRKFKFKINDDTWEAYLITKEEADELDEILSGVPDGFAALTTTKSDGNCLFIVEGHVTKNVINHELFHIYVSYFCIDSSNINIDSFEEIIAEFLEHHLDKFIKKRNSIFNKFKKLEESGRKK